MDYPTEDPHAPQTTAIKTGAQRQPGRARRVLAKAWPLALTAVVSVSVGIAAGAGSVDEAPYTAQSKIDSPTVAPEATVESVGSATCQAVSKELFSMLEDYTAEVSIPYSDVVITLVEQLQYGADASTITAMTAQMQDITENVNDLTARVENVSPSYTECLNGADS